MQKLNYTHNLLIGRPAKEVREGLEKIFAKDYLTISLQEAGTYLGIIRDLAKEHHYRVIVLTDGAKGMNSSVLLVKNTVELLASGVARSGADWIGPRRGIRWPGRPIPWAIIRVAGHLILVTSIHAPTGRNGLPLNRVAFRMFCRRLRRLYKKKLKTYPMLKFFFAGDWNCPAKANDKRSTKKLVTAKLDGWIVDPKCTPPIDYAATNLLLVIAKKGPDYDSDHDSASFDLAA